jgi:hypothetical protein
MYEKCWLHHPIKGRLFASCHSFLWLCLALVWISNQIWRNTILSLSKSLIMRCHISARARRPWKRVAMLSWMPLVRNPLFSALFPLLFIPNRNFCTILGCGLLALQFPECTKHLGPIVPGTFMASNCQVAFHVCFGRLIPFDLA